MRCNDDSPTSHARRAPSAPASLAPAVVAGRPGGPFGRGTAPTRRGGPMQHRGTAGRVMVIEDDADIREEIAELLEDHGYLVEGVADGLSGLRAMKSGPPPELIILDLRMPVMDGWQFRVEQKRDPALAAIPVVAISADGSPQAEAVDADYFLKKPFAATTLLTVVSQLLLRVERERSNAALAHADRLASLGVLAAGIAHEINNPLAFAMTNLEFVAALLTGIPDGGLVEDVGSILQAVQEAREGCERVRLIVRGLGSLVRSDETSAGPLDVRLLLDAAARMAQNEIRHRGTLIKELGDVPAVHGNEGKLSQVFLNLLVNAAHALAEDRAATNVVRLVTRTTADGWACVEVQDTGCGIAESDLGRIFDPFFTTKPVGSGTGLGLSISQGIVSAVGGRIEVESQVGRGSQFRVLLPPAAAEDRVGPFSQGLGLGPPPVVRPTVPVPAAHAGPPAPAADPAAATAAERRPRVLVIDDEASICRALQRALADDNDVTTVTDAAAALALFGAGARFDVLLCDLMMPRMSGFDLHQLLARDLPDQAARMIFLTGGVFSPRAREFLTASAAAAIEKPFAISEVVATVRQAIRQRGRLADATADDPGGAHGPGDGGVN